MSEFNALFEANKDKHVAVTNKVTNVAVNYRITQLSDKIGTMKNGDKNAYVILTAEDGTSTVINLHPQSAQKLFKKGEDGHMKIVEAAAEEVKADEVVHPADWALVEGSQEGVIAAEANAVVATEPAAVEAAPVVEEAKVETAEVTTVPETKEEVKAEEAAPKEKSKKERTIEIVHAGWDAGQERKDIIAKLRTELNMGVPGSNTYYQNVLSGNWGGRKGPASGTKK